MPDVKSKKVCLLQSLNKLMIDKTGLSKAVVLIVGIFCLIQIPLFADFPISLNFDYIQSEDGLASSSISSIVQDQYGFMWFGTQNGLNRYDGYTFISYQNEPYEKNSLSHNLIQTMYLDDTGILWLGTYGGLNRFDPATETFTRYQHDPADPESLSNNVVVSICKDQNGSLWVGTLNGLNRLNEETGTFTHLKHDAEDPKSLGHDVVRALHLDSLGNLWIGTYGGLGKLDVNTLSITNFVHNPDDPASISSNNVMAIKEDEQGALWLGLWGGGIGKFTPDSGTCQNWELPDERIYTILLDNETLWAGSYGGGLISFSMKNGDSILYTSNTPNANSITNNTVYSLFKDYSGIIWIGTNGGGLNRIIPGWDQFRLIRHSDNDPDSLSSGKTNLMFIDSKDTLWISNYNSGLDRYIDETDSFVHYTHDAENENSLSNDILNFIYEDSDQVLWIGTNSGISQYDREHDIINRYSLDKLKQEVSISNEIFTVFVEDSEKNIWLGTHDSGLLYYSKQADRWYQFVNNQKDVNSLSDNLVRRLLIDSTGVLWVGTNNGLGKYNPVTKNFKNYYHDEDDVSSISSNNIYDMFEDSTGTLWIGTSGGLNRYDRVSDAFSFYNKKNGLPDDTIVGIIESADKELWVSTRFGLSVFNNETEVFRKVDRSLGFPSLEMTSGKASRPDGRIYFGTVEGIMRINPEIQFNDYNQLNLVLTSFRVLGKPLEGDTPPYALKELTLKHTDVYFDFEFSELQFFSPFSSEFAYILEGFDEDWIYTKSRNYGSYTNIPPGSYTLRVKVLNGDGRWNEQEIMLPITILPPFWKTGYAYSMYVAIGLIIILLIVLVLRNKWKKNDQLLEQERVYNQLLETRISERTKEIETEKERLAVTLRSIGDGVITTDVYGNVMSFNRVAENLTGWQEQEAIGKAIQEVFMVQDSHTRAALIDPVSQVLKAIHPNEQTKHALLLTRDGIERIIDSSAAPIKNVRSETVGTVLVFRDITEDMRIQNRLQRNDKLESLGTLAGGLAHDFNNLLGGLFGYIDLAKNITTDASVSHYLQEAMGVFDRAKDLTQQLLTFARGGAPIRKTMFIGELVTKSVNFALSGSSVKSSIRIIPDLWACDVDENQIAQVIDNLVINAKQAMNDSGTLTVSVENLTITDQIIGYGEPLKSGEYIKISITDSGKGIDPLVMDQVFDPFFTTKQSGNGLGLSTCYSIMQRHQGGIDVCSNPPNGSTFTLYLPKSEQMPDTAKKKISFSHTGSGTILVMDDEESLRSLLSAILVRMGYDVLTAADGDEALMICKKSIEDEKVLQGCILDLTIPGGKGGLDIVSELLELQPALAVFASSGYSNDPIMAEPEKYGFTGSIQKPYRIEDIAKILRDRISQNL